MKRSTLITLVILIVFSSFGFKCGKEGLPPGIDEGDIFRGKLSEDHKLRTPAGATIASKHSIDPSFAALVDGGFEDVFRIAKAPPNNYDLDTPGINAARYKVWLFPRSDKCENAAFLVATIGVYDGSEWDKDPRPNYVLLCAAGMTMMQGNPITGAGMVITDDAGIMRTIVRYEAEHSILFYVDPVRYNATQYHGEGQGHPILGDGPPAELSVHSSQYKAVSLKLPIDIADGDSIVGAKGQAACVLLTK